MKGLYKANIDCGRAGNLYGLFIADVESINELIESKRVIEFGEVLGKHSDISGNLEPTDVTLVTTDEAFIAQAEALQLCVGINPFAFITDEDEGYADNEDDEEWEE